MDPARGAAVRTRHDGALRYELAEPIATGGMAIIRRGFDRWTQREIAHKRLRIEGEALRPRLTALFQREYDTLARLEHPNIVEVYDYGFDAHGPYYTMELLSGSDLSKLAPLPYPEACRILRDITSALALVHARRLLHRDVSPNNVRLTSGGIAKLIDFGALASFGRPGEIAGTPAFIAPECLDEVELDQRTDLYSLGALAYWTLTGKCAVEAQRIDDLARAWRAPIIAPSAHVPELPTALDNLICSLMSHDREHRPRSAAEVIESLTTISGLAHERNERKVAYSYLKHPPLAGRSAAVGALRAALASALEGRGSVVIVDGVAGLGRSALFEQFTIDAQLRGATVLRAEGRAAVGPHGVLRRLTQLGARIYPDLEGSERSRRQLLELEKGKGDSVVHPMEALERTAQAAARLRKLLLSLSARGPLAIVVDDADLADADSIGLLASMAEELVRHPILLLLSVHGPVPQDMLLAYERLSEDAHKIALQTLEETEVIELVQGIFGAVPNVHRTALWLHHETGGNPAQCVDLLRLLLQRGAIRYARGTFTLPHDIDGDVARDRRSNALLTRLAGVSQSEMRLVELLSLHRGSLSTAQLALASGIPQREILLAVEQLVHCGVAFFVTDCVSLRGESLRAVVEKAIDVERKRELHLALAGAVESADEDKLASQLERAWHLFRSGEAGELQAADLIVDLLSTYGHDVSMSAGSVPLLEAALAVYERRGASESQCAPLLAALSVTGYYGNLEAHRKYLRRALSALAQQSGLKLATKLAPWLGAVFALWVGLIWATWFRPFFPRRFGRGSIKRRIQDLLTAASCGAATAAIVFDVETAHEIKQLLAPFFGFPRRSAPGYGHQFCNATIDQTMAESLHARDAYARVRSAIQSKVLLLDERLRKQLNLGCLHGQAHSEIEHSDGATLLLADELEQGSAFFAPSAEAVRSIYHMMRGRPQTAELHRARGELLALRGGTSWSTAAVLALRTIGPASFTRDSVALEHAVAELDRLAKVEPSLNKFCVVSRARLALLRGQPSEAHDLLARVLSESREPLEAHRYLRGTYAEALCELGQFAEAKAQCLLAIEGLSEEQRNYLSILRLPFLQLARAETGLGNFVRARELLEKHARNAALRKNPLEQGALHRELALLALAERDADEFELHCDAMVDHYQQTQCPGLLKQRDELWSLAVACGVRKRPSISISLAGTSAAPVDCETFVETRVPAKPKPESE